MSFSYELISKPDANGQSKVISQYDASQEKWVPVNQERSQKRNDRDIKNLHMSESDISHEVRSNFNKAKNLMVGGPLSAVNSLGSSVLNTLKNIGFQIDNLNTPNALRFKKYGMLAVGGAFVLFAVTSLVRALSSLWSKDKSNKSLKFIDAFVKWTMGIGIGSAALGSGPFKIEGLKPILFGTGLTLVLSQLAGLDSGKSNILGTITKLTGTQDLFKGLITRSGMLPPVLDNQVNNS
jgi:hypothetical protein